MDDLNVISRIADRAIESGHLPPDIDRLWLMMDIDTVHCRTPLDLYRWLDADLFNFMHDVVGILNNINRKTGQLENCFLPRFTRQEMQA